MTAASLPNTAPAAAPPSRFERRKEEILRAAAALFNRIGLREATLAVIASEIGLNLKSLRYYFEKREDLVAAAFLHSIDLHRALAEDALAAPDLAGRVRRFIGGYFALQARVRGGEEAEFVHFGDLRALTEPQLTQVGRHYVGLFRAVRRLFEDADAPLDPDGRNAAAHLLISHLLWSVVWIGNHVPADFPRVAERMSDILLHGLAAGPVRLPAAAAVARPFAVSDRLSPDSFLRAATRLINDQGYRGASVERISAELGVTKGAFYHHNETRDELVVACFERTFALIRDAQDAALAEAADGLHHVAGAAAALVARQMVADGELLRTAALTAVGPELRVEMQRRLSLSTGRFADMLNDGLIDGSVRLCDIRIAAEMVTGAINAAQELRRWGPGADPDNAAELFVGSLLRGLLAG